jgi:hypothetical protein
MDGSRFIMNDIILMNRNEPLVLQRLPEEPALFLFRRHFNLEITDNERDIRTSWTAIRNMLSP